MAHIHPPGFPIERGKIHEFANSILDDNPLYHDEEAASADGLPGVVAPPTFSSASAFFPEKGGARPRVEGLDMRFALHGGQELSYERPLFAGDVLRAEVGETKHYEKKGRRGGTMKFWETEMIYRDQAGEVVLRIRNTLIQTAGAVGS